jgi:WD40 repeat protein
MVHDLVFVDEETLASIGADDTVRVWRLATNQRQTSRVTEAETFRLDQSLPRTLALSADGQLLAVADDFGYLSLWRTRPFERVAAWFAHSELGAFSLAFVPPGDTLISGGADGALKFWDTHSQSLRMTMECTTIVNAIAVAADGERVAWVGEDGVVRLLRTR